MHPVELCGTFQKLTCKYFIRIHAEVYVVTLARAGAGAVKTALACNEIFIDPDNLMPSTCGAARKPAR